MDDLNRRVYHSVVKNGNEQSIVMKSAVLQELLETEKKYLNELLEMHGAYYAILCSLDEFPAATSCIKTMNFIANISKSLIDEITNTESSYLSICSAFRSLIIHIKKYYGEYVCSYSQAIFEVQHSQNAVYKEDVKRIRECFGHTLPLESYFLLPIQRIMRYLLLMKSLLKECNGAVNILMLTDLVKELEDLNDYINELNRQHEGSQLLPYLNSILLNLKTFIKSDDIGVLKLEDDFTRHGHKLHIFLFSKCILVTKRLKSEKSYVKYLFDLDKVSIIENKDNKELAIGIKLVRNPKQVYWITASNMEHKEIWLTYLKACILDVFKLKLGDTKMNMLVGEKVANKINTIFSVSDDILKIKQSTENDSLDDFNDWTIKRSTEGLSLGRNSGTSLVSSCRESEVSLNVLDEEKKLDESNEESESSHKVENIPRKMSSFYSKILVTYKSSEFPNMDEVNPITNESKLEKYRRKSTGGSDLENNRFYH